MFRVRLAVGLLTAAVTTAVAATPSAALAQAPVPTPDKSAFVRAQSPVLLAERSADTRGQALARLAGRSANPRLASAAGRVRLVVRLNDRSQLQAVAEAGTAAGGKLRHTIPQISTVSFDVPAASASGLARLLKARGSVRSVEVAVVRHFSYVPNDPMYNTHEQTYLNPVTAPAAWNTAKGDASVKVAVVDSGVDLSHPDLAGKVVGAYNAVSGSVDVTDDLGHGTFVAGVAAAASDNSAGITGVGFNTSLLAVKVADPDGNMYVDDVAAGIVWAADHGAKVINMSLGSPDSAQSDADAVSYAQSQGVLIVAAAGNEGSSVRNYPAAYPGVLAVGATDAAGHRAGFSTYGSWVSVGAPGVNIYSTTPRNGSAFFNANYDSGDGTSFSSPIVAGEAALLAAAAPSASSSVLRKAIVDSAHGYAGLGLGTGQVDIASALTHLPPSSTATLTSPAAGTTVQSPVPLVASSNAPSVQFAVDGVALGAPQVVASGSAQATWETWGLADGSHSITVADCNSAGCGDVSGPTAVVVQNPAPTISSPAVGDTVSEIVTVRVRTNDAAPKVRLSVDDAPVGAPVGVVGGSADLTWASGGSPNGAHTLSVATCTSAGACKSSASAMVNVVNSPPALTSPAPDTSVSGLTTLSASGPHGGLLFRRDGVVIGFDSASPFTLAYDFSEVADGSHSLEVQACGATANDCNGLISAAHNVTVKSLHPKISALTPSVFSPNADKRVDTTKVAFSLPDAESVGYSVKNRVGTVVGGPVSLGSLAKGAHAFVWNGLTSGGKRNPDGIYTVVLSASSGSGAATLRGSSKANVRIDTVAPSLTGLVRAGGTLYPYPDGYRDTMAPSVRLGEMGRLTLSIRNSRGTVVRTLVASHPVGTFAVTWNGRTSKNALAPAGSYRYFFTSQDGAQNRRNSALYPIPVSAARLVGTAVSRAVTPAATMTSLIIGDCSAIGADSTWKGGYDYLSDYYSCYNAGDPSDSSDVAASEHQLTLPAAIKYGGISLGVTGQRAVAGYNDTAVAWYRTTADDLVNDTTLGASYGTRNLPGAPTSYLAAGRTLRWVVGAFYGSYYTVRSFTVRYTYYVLR